MTKACLKMHPITAKEDNNFVKSLEIVVCVYIVRQNAVSLKINIHNPILPPVCAHRQSSTRTS